MKKKIVKLVAYFHPPFDSRIFHREAKALKNAGYEITILVPHTKDEEVDGIQIKAIPFPKSSFDKLFYAAFITLKEALKQPKEAIYHIHDFKLLLVGYILKLSGRTVIYDAHEDLPLHISYQHWIPKAIKPFYKMYFRILEWCSGWFFDGLIVSEPLISRHFPKNKAVPIQTFPLKRDFEIQVQKFDKPSILYAGTLTLPRGFNNLIDTLDEVHRQMDFDFYFAGKLAPESLKFKLQNKPYLKLMEFLPLHETYKLMKACHVTVYLPLKIPRYIINHPIKLFEFLAAGLPVVTYDFGYTGDVIKKFNAGIVVDYPDNQKAAEALVTILTTPEIAKTYSLSGKNKVFDEFNWENESIKLVDFYKKIASA